MGTWHAYAIYIEYPIGGGNPYWGSIGALGPYIEFRKNLTYKKWNKSSEGNIYNSSEGTYKIDGDKISFDGGFWKKFTFSESYQRFEIEKEYRYEKK